MDSALRDRVQKLADDLAWLEGHARRQPDLAAQAGRLRLAAALARNVLGPAVEGEPARPLFVAVVGGAGAGKSTVVNFLCGKTVAEANPQAGYTRHPTAFAPGDGPLEWPGTLGFLGPLRRLADDAPGNVDEDVYQLRRFVGPDAPGHPATDFVVWDCPDMTTWASSGYVGRLTEVAALADVVVYVASDERYNDETPTQFLHLLIKAGKAVVVCLTKVREADAGPLAEHFRREVLNRLPDTPAKDLPPVPVVALPQLPAATRSDPAGLGARYRAALWNQLLVLCPTPEAARRRTRRNALAYLDTAAAGLLEYAKRDLSELQAWEASVGAGRADFEERYRREFLSGERFNRFDRTREEVLELLELPGNGRPVSAALAMLRAPYRFARDKAAKLLTRPEAPNLSEQTVCTAALAAWLDRLQAEAVRRGPSHPLWKRIAGGFQAGLRSEATDRFAAVFHTFAHKETDELDHAAAAVPDYLRRHPGVLQAARVGTLGADLAAGGAAVAATVGPNWSAWHLLLIPLAMSLSHQGVELGVRQVVDASRAGVRDHREALVREHLTGPLAAWLAAWPAAAGSDLARLQEVLARVPAAVRDVGAALPGGAP